MSTNAASGPVLEAGRGRINGGICLIYTPPAGDDPEEGDREEGRVGDR